MVPIFLLAFFCYKDNNDDDDDDDEDDNSDFINVSRKIAEENPPAYRGPLKYLKYLLKYKWVNLKQIKWS